MAVVAKCKEPCCTVRNNNTNVSRLPRAPDRVFPNRYAIFSITFQTVGASGKLTRYGTEGSRAALSSLRMPTVGAAMLYGLFCVCAQSAGEAATSD
ncbi:hypothetical protein NDU88_001217 [Pleurodeles waltl]|uniref:Uncharacterized protein n=1 Tax=Pleurodeles waltl TaxID=8319 RepID=A0AAV7U7H7_PLEWA|nr:hypothetical protein NDU88_001217 [Pleurodeles waltl]